MALGLLQTALALSTVISTRQTFQRGKAQRLDDQGQRSLSHSKRMFGTARSILPFTPDL